MYGHSHSDTSCSRLCVTAVPTWSVGKAIHRGPKQNGRVFQSSLFSVLLVVLEEGSDAVKKVNLCAKVPTSYPCICPGQPTLSTLRLHWAPKMKHPASIVIFLLPSSSEYIQSSVLCSHITPIDGSDPGPASFVSSTVVGIDRSLCKQITSIWYLYPLNRFTLYHTSRLCPLLLRIYAVFRLPGQRTTLPNHSCTPARLQRPSNR